MTGNNPVNRIKMGTKIHVLIDKKRDTATSVVIISASINDIRVVTKML
jgi:hypothetical protein